MEWLRYIWEERPWYGKLLFGLLAIGLPTIGGTGLIELWAWSTQGVAFSPLLGCLCGLLVLAGGWCLIMLATHFAQKTTTTHGSARFASMKDVQSMAGTRASARATGRGKGGAVAPIGGNLELGTYRKRSIALTHKQQESHVLLLAPTGKGKT